MDQRSVETCVQAVVNTVDLVGNLGTDLGSLAISKHGRWT